MGWNTTVIVCNDATDYIENDPEFGRKLSRAIGRVASRREPVDVAATRYDDDGNPRGCHVNAATVIESHHADGTNVVAVGGNTAVDLGLVWPYGDDEDKEVRILRALADKLGYSIRKKPGKKS